MKILLATQNANKVKEILKVWEGLPVEILNLKDFPQLKSAEETGTTFQENALLKAKAIADQTGWITLAEDSGFAVDALGGRPGVYSARFAGETASDEDNLRKVLFEYLNSPLKGLNKKASFVCAAAWIDPIQKKCKVFEEKVEGEISEIPLGEKGFGYDPLFFYPLLGKTFAQIEIEVKNKLSHRAKAFEKLKKIILENYF